MLQIFVYQSIWCFDVLLLKSLSHHNTFAGIMKNLFAGIMKKIIYLFLLLSIGIQAQDINLKGKVSVPEAKVILTSRLDPTAVKMTLTQNDGSFSFSIPKPGSYQLTVQIFGFKDYQSEWLELNQDKTLDPIVLISDSTELQGITITTSKPMIEVKADKTVLNVQSSLSATGTNGFDLLRKAPGVVIDNQDNLIVEGKSGISIYIDGRLSLLSGADLVNYLKGLQAADIETVEVITQPSSKYDAAGNAGIINLKLKKNKNYGTNGTLATGYAQGVYAKSNTSLSLNHRGEKTNIYGNYSNLLGKNRRFINSYRVQSDEIFDSRSANVSDDKSHNVRAGLDYFISKNKTFGVVINGSFSDYDINTVTRTPIIDLASGQTQQVLLAKGQAASNNRNLSSNINYRYADSTGYEFNIDGDIASYTAGRNELQPNTYYNPDETEIIREAGFRMGTPVNINLYSLKTDFTRPLGKGNLSYGLKSSFVKTDNTLRFYDVSNGTEEFNSTRSNIFKYQENINAAYVNFSQTFEKFSFQLGLRAEQTNSEGELSSVQSLTDNNVKRNYLDFFPSGGITYNVNLDNKLGLIYSRRVERPNYRSLNPFEVNSDELSSSKGNPLLQPQYTQNIKLTHTYKYTLNTSLSYSYITDFIAQINEAAANNRNIMSPQNIATLQVINLGLSYPFKVSEWWNVYGSANAFRSIYESHNEKFTPVSKNTFSLYGQNTFSLPKNFKFEISGWFNTPNVWGGTYQTHSMGSLDLALQKQLLDKRLSVRMSATDILYTSNWSGDTQYGELYIRANGGYESRQFKVNLSYNFGSKEVKEIQKRNSAAEDEKGRITN